MKFINTKVDAEAHAYKILERIREKQFDFINDLKHALETDITQIVIKHTNVYNYYLHREKYSTEPNLPMISVTVYRRKGSNLRMIFNCDENNVVDSHVDPLVYTLFTYFRDAEYYPFWSDHYTDEAVTELDIFFEKIYSICEGKITTTYIMEEK